MSSRPYLCRRCGQPKRGHVCTNPGASVTSPAAVVTLDDSDDDEVVMAMPMSGAKRKAAEADPRPVLASAVATASSAPSTAPSASASSGGSTLIEQVQKIYSIKEQYRVLAEEKDKELDERDKEIEQLKSVLHQSVTTFTESKRKLSDENKALKAQVDAQASAAAAVPVVAACKNTSELVLKEILASVQQQFQNKMDELEKKHLRKKKKAKTGGSSGSTSVAASPPAMYTFDLFDASAGGWFSLNDPGIVSALNDLATGVTDKVTYSYNGNGYEAVVAPQPDPSAQSGQITIQQTNTTHPAHTQRTILSSAAPVVAPVAPPPAAADPLPVSEGSNVAKHLLYKTPFITFTDAQLKDWFDRMDANDDIVTGPSADLSALATLWGHYASQYLYDASLTKVCVNPRVLKLWLEIAMKRERLSNMVRIVMHGSRDYDGLASDPKGFNPMMANASCAKGEGHYVSTSDHVPCDYNSGATIGSGQLSLLLTHDNDGDPSRSGSYVNYRLNGSTTPSAISSDGSLVTAICVKDYDLLLTLGYPVSTGSRNVSSTAAASGAAGSSS